LGGDHTVWNEVAPLLEGDFRLIRPDLRGHGRSGSPAGSTYSFDELLQDLLRLLDRLELREVHMVGMSAGAFLALRLARDHPGRVRSLVIVNGSAYCDAHTREILESWNQEYREGGEDALVLRLMKDLYDRDWMEAHLDQADLMRKRLKEAQVGPLIQFSDQIKGFDMRGRLARIRAPTLILQGMSDVVVDPSHGRFLRQSIPGSELKIYRDTGHLMPVERPKETADAVREFVQAVERRSPPAAPTA
jgi:3-oxoadipate enol-lactonase